jgi:hypothetical protein
MTHELDTQETHRTMRTATGDKIHLGLANLELHDGTLCGCARSYKLTAGPAVTLADALAQVTCTSCQERGQWVQARRGAVG